MRERLTKGDVAKIEAELEHRKLVIRKEAAAGIAEAAAQGTGARILSIMQRKSTEEKMRAGFVIWNGF